MAGIVQNICVKYNGSLQWGRAEGGKAGLGDLSEASSPEIREIQKNFILFSLQDLDSIQEPQYCKRPQSPPGPTFQSMMESL